MLKKNPPPALKIQRVVAGLTQQELAQALHCSQGRISSIERRMAVPTKEEVRAMAKVFGVKPSALGL